MKYARLNLVGQLADTRAGVPRLLPLRFPTGSGDHQIKRFATLRCVKNQRPKAADMSGDMNEQVKLWFVKPLGVPKSSCGEKIDDSAVQILLQA
jgi:hypothetical protein